MNFSIKELVDISIGIEESGYYFYSQCRKKFDRKDIAEIFAFLAEEELRHKEIFEKMFSGLSDPRGHFTEDYFLYLKAIGEERVFKNNSDVDAAIKEITSLRDVFSTALTAEKDSILWYSELLSMYGSDREAQTVLQKLINEERKHVVIILDLKEKTGLSQ